MTADLAATNVDMGTMTAEMVAADVVMGVDWATKPDAAVTVYFKACRVCRQILNEGYEHSQEECDLRLVQRIMES